MQKTGINFKDIFEYCNNEQQKELSRKAPVHEVLLDMAVTKLPGLQWRLNLTEFPTYGMVT